MDGAGEDQMPETCYCPECSFIVCALHTILAASNCKHGGIRPSQSIPYVITLSGIRIIDV